MNAIIERRKEARYPCINMPLLYSAVNDSCIDNLAECIYQASAIDLSLSGLAFDIDFVMKIGEKLVIQFEKINEQENENLIAEVRSCRKISPSLYRVGVCIVIDANTQKELALEDISSIFSALIDTQTIPNEIESICPSCEKKAIFHFIACQPVLVKKGVMPIYDCGNCGSTRSFTSILGINNLI